MWIRSKNDVDLKYCKPARAKQLAKSVVSSVETIASPKLDLGHGLHRQCWQRTSSLTFQRYLARSGYTLMIGWPGWGQGCWYVFGVQAANFWTIMIEQELAFPTFAYAQNIRFPLEFPKLHWRTCALIILSFFKTHMIKIQGYVACIYVLIATCHVCKSYR